MSAILGLFTVLLLVFAALALASLFALYHFMPLILLVIAVVILVRARRYMLHG